MKYAIICDNCNKAFVVDDPEFTKIVDEIEGRISEMVSILHRNDVNVSYKSHNHIFPILETVVRCCAVPDIYFYEIDDDAWNALAESSDSCFSEGVDLIE